MDPYLEDPARWPDVHLALIAELRRVLGRQLQPRYFVRAEERSYLTEGDDLVFVGRPDSSVTGAGGEPSAGAPEVSPGAVVVEVPTPDLRRERFLEIQRADTREVVTVLEVLSPTNKLRSGEGRALYERKRREILASATHLVEIDLIRRGEPMPVRGPSSSSSYRILVSRSDSRPRAELFCFALREPIPSFHLPLRRREDEPLVDLQAALAEVYDTGAYRHEIDYREDPAPNLDSADQLWADERLRAEGLRS